jgi:uncharacterized membrane protein (UPF0127 family)
VRAGLLLLLFLAGSCAAACGKKPPEAASPVAPPSDDEAVVLPPGASRDALLDAVDEGLRTPGKGPDFAWFVVARAHDRHGPETRENAFHVLVGAGVAMPAGTLRIRRSWLTSGEIDGVNEEPQRLGISVAVERGSPRPFPPETVEAVRAFCEALRARVPLHADCVLAMGEIPYTRPHEADPDERALAAAAREALAPPAADATVTIHAGGRSIRVACERRATPNAISVGMMFRRRFDGEDRGMLFEYPHRDYRRFWMRNVFIPIDVAYVRDGAVAQIQRMAPAAGTPSADIPFYPSDAAVRHALEMPAGWFERNGVGIGARVEGLD